MGGKLNCQKELENFGREASETDRRPLQFNNSQ